MGPMWFLIRKTQIPPRPSTSNFYSGKKSAMPMSPKVVIHFIALHHATTQCNALQRTATHCNTLQHTATHCNTLQHTARDIYMAKSSTCLQRTATHCNTLQRTATHCNAHCLRRMCRRKQYFMRHDKFLCEMTHSNM